MKRFASLVALLLVMALMFSACTPSAGTEPTPSPSSEEAAADPTPAAAPEEEAPSEEPAAETEEAPADETAVEETPEAAAAADFPAPGEMGEDYHYIFTSDITSLNYLVTNKSVDAELISKTLDPLVLVNAKGEIEPGIAESWSQSEDGLKWTFKLREGVQWLRPDGTEYAEVTAQDFVDSVEFLLDPSLASFVADFVINFIAGAQDYYDGTTTDFSTVGVKAIDKYTVEYTTTSVIPYFLSLTTYSCYLPISKAFVEEIGGIENFGTTNENYLVYGEYLFTNWDLGQLWELTKNEKYYYKDRVHTQNLDFVYVEDASVRFEMYKRGEITAAPVMANQYDLAMADPEIAPYVYRSALTSASWQYYFQINTEVTPESTNLKPAIQNLNFRKAVFAAINRTALCSVSTKIAPEELRRNTLNIWGLSMDESGNDYMTYGNLNKYEAEGFDYYDAAKAKEYLEAAKTELGDTVSWPVTIQLLVQSEYEPNVMESNILKQSLEEALGTENVIVSFYEIAGDAYYEESEAGAFDLTYGGWSPDFADPSAYLEIYQSDGYLGSRSGASELPEQAEFDNMMQEAKSLTVLSERYAALAAAEEYMIENALVLPYRATGGNFSINNNLNPYDTFESVPYGLCDTMFKDRIFGTTPLTAEERAAKKAAFDASK